MSANDLDIDEQMNPEFVGQQKGKKENLFRELTSILTARYILAFSEKNLTVTEKNINHDYALFPKSFYSKVSAMNEAKTIDFNFHGSVGWNKYQAINRAWIFDFISKNFTNKSFYIDTILRDNYVSLGSFDYSHTVRNKKPIGVTPVCNPKVFDKKYFSNLKKSKFCLCPAGDRPWSIRFYEALMCKAIPIVKYSWETWRSLEERKLDYKFYFADDKEFVYREDWAEHNYALFMKYHILDTMEADEISNNIETKCIREGCGYLIHSTKMGKGTHCCMACQNVGLGRHGPKCEKVLIQNAQAIS